MQDNETFRVWVGCLACYNEGRLVGEWFDAADAPQDMDDFVERVKHPRATTHEELWCFDTENSPVDGEMSPMDAAKYAEMIENLDIPLGALTAWLDNHHEKLSEDAIEQATDAYVGDSEDALDECYEGVYPEADLPEWARSSYSEIIADIKRNDRIGGGWYEHSGYYFWAI